MKGLRAGSAVRDITPQDSQFLFGYPHVPRYSTGVHDPLLSSALYLSDGQTELILVANDIIFVTKAIAHRARTQISAATGVPTENIMLTATHTHSGPMTVDYISNEHDAAVPKTDPKYVRFFEGRMVEAAIAAHAAARPAEAGLAIADGTGVGTNRRDPNGPSDPQVPVLMVRSTDNHTPIACMVVYSMHPTVLHQDSTLISGDFPGMARQYLQQHVLGSDCPVLYHTGPAGNQSPRHVVHANTFAEATRLGEMLGQAIGAVIPEIAYDSALSLRSAHTFVHLPPRTLPTVAEAENDLATAAARLARLRELGAPRWEIRTAEVDWFGAEETLTLARAAQEGRMEAIYRACLPAEIQVFKIGPWAFVGWPGEIFVEHALALKQQVPNIFVISLANGELQGYIVTEAIAEAGGYEASNAIFGPSSGSMLISATVALVESLAGA